MKTAYVCMVSLLLVSCGADRPAALSTNEQAGATAPAGALLHEPQGSSDAARWTNRPPQLDKVKLMPEVFKPGDTLSVDASGSDPDNDAVTLLYAWTRNGEPAGEGRQIEGPIKRGDKLSIKIVPFDGTAHGQPVVLDREVVNLPPVIVQNDHYELKGDVYTYQVSATDPDGDALTYALTSAPAGMSIDASTGQITWKVEPKFTGKASFHVAVTDGHGGKTEQDLSLTITLEPPKTPPT